MRIIDITGLRKSFKSRSGRGPKSAGSGSKRRTHTVVVDAVRGIDIHVDEGECFGFLGPNGAGKSTTLKILATLLKPDSGSLTVAGHDLLVDPVAVRRRIGYVSQAGGTDRYSTGRENLYLQGRLYGLSDNEANSRIGELVDMLELGGFVDRPGTTYSGGQRRKLDVALGMVHRPKVLFLDEPTTGLDPVSRAQLWERVRGLKRAGITVFLTTHYLDEADALCDRISIIDDGTIAAEGSPDELKRRISGDVLTVTVNHVEDAGARATALLAGREFVREISGEGNRLRLVVENGGSAIPSVLRTLESDGVGVMDIALSRPSLDDVFLKVTGHSIEGGGATSSAAATYAAEAKEATAISASEETT